MHEHFVKANGIRLHTLEYPGGEPPLILLHGLTANANSFDGYIAAGLSPRFHAYALDQRGRGQSSKPESGYAIEDHAQDVIALMDALGLKSAALAGHSFGGLVSMVLAANYPDRISHLVVIDAAAEFHPDTVTLIQASLDRMGRVLPSWEAYQDAIKAQPQYEGWWDEQIESYYRADVETFEDGSVKSRLYPHGILEAAQKGLEVNWREIACRVTQPAMLLNAPMPYFAGAPPIISREQAQATVALMPNGRYVEIPGNHVTMMYGKGAHRAVQVITEFLSEI